MRETDRGWPGIDNVSLKHTCTFCSTCQPVAEYASWRAFFFRLVSRETTTRLARKPYTEIKRHACTTYLHGHYIYIYICIDYRYRCLFATAVANDRFSCSLYNIYLPINIKNIIYSYLCIYNMTGCTKAHTHYTP